MRLIALKGGSGPGGWDVYVCFRDRAYRFEYQGSIDEIIDRMGNNMHDSDFFSEFLILPETLNDSAGTLMMDFVPGRFSIWHKAKAPKISTRELAVPPSLSRRLSVRE